MEKDKGKGTDWKSEKFCEDQVESLKKYRKHNPVKKAKAKVWQTRKGLIIAESPFSSVPRKKGGAVPLYPKLSGVTLKVTTTPDAWKKIESFTLDHPDWFGLEFYSNFANPAVLKIEIIEKNKPRGKQKQIHQFVNVLERRAGILYAFLGYWCKKPIEERPDYLQKFFESIPEKWSNYVFKSKRGTNKPYRLTRYCIERIYSEEINDFELKLFDDPANFKQTYIHADGRAARLAKFFSRKSPQEVATFAYRMPALEYIFQSLKVL